MIACGPTALRAMAAPAFGAPHLADRVIADASAPPPAHAFPPEPPPPRV